MTKPIIAALAIMLAIPLVQLSAMQDAEARPGSILRESRDDGERSHNMERRNDRRRSSSNNERRTSSNNERRTSTARPVGPPQPTGNTRPVQRDRQTTTTRHTRQTRHSNSRHSSTRHTTRVHTSHTTVHHHHHRGSSSRHRYYEEPAQAAPREPKRSVDGYLTLGLGLSGFAAPQISDRALPGTDYNLGLGVSGSLLGFELGFHGGAFSFDTTGAGSIDIALMGVTGDLKIQPSILFFEPFVMAGIGGYHFQDAYLNEAALGSALRMGAGIDLRINRIAFSLRYLRNFYGLANNYSFVQGLGAQTESVGLNFTAYF